MSSPPTQRTAERAVARVDPAAIERNCRTLASRTGSARLCAVVKADGYGHGATRAASAAVAGGASWLAVATASEATELRTAGIAGPLLVMGALTRSEVDEALAAKADLIAWSGDFVAAVAARESKARVHVKYDSGMGRLGTADAAEALALCDSVASDARVELAGLMTHFATADELDDDYFPEQLERFARVADEVSARYRGVVRHAANSAAVLRDERSHYDMVRCGVAIYGLDPFQHDPYQHGLEPALELESYVASVKPFEPGQSAGYGRTWRARRRTRVAVLPIGYGDGVRRALSNNAEVLIRGRRHPLVGTVSMDNVTVDLGPDSDVEAGEPAVLIGAQGNDRILAEEMARRLETINYEVTCGLGARVPRVSPAR